ncbi:MAG TPA: RDD family protein [Elusimicrobiales bacterium]|nr:RDD family protein [Elusimicrobiales bacterium]
MGTDDNFVFTPQSGPGLQVDFAPDLEQGMFAAGFNERFLAYVIDAAPFLAFHYFSFGILSKSGAITASPAAEFKMKLGWIGLYILYETLLSSGGRATLGKYLLNIRVQAKDGGPLSLPRAFARALGYFVSSATFNLGYLLALFTPENKALHDYIGGSRVVSLRERSNLADGLVLAFSWGLMAILAGAWINNNVLKLTPAEKRQIIAAHKTISKLGVLEEFYQRSTGHYTNDIKNLASMTGNVNAVRAELFKTLEPQSLVISSNGRSYVITAKARNWRKTEVEVKSKTTLPPRGDFP